MGRLDPATGNIDEYEIFVKNPVARKAGMDSADNVWVGLHSAGKLMKIDYKTTKMTVYSPPTENAGPYSIQGDPKSQLVWFSEQLVDVRSYFYRFSLLLLVTLPPRRHLPSATAKPTLPSQHFFSADFSSATARFFSPPKLEL